MKAKLTNKILIPCVTVAFVILILVSYAAGRDRGNYAHSEVCIRKGSEVIQTVSIEQLMEPCGIDLEGNTICIEKDGVYMKKADCPDRLCVHSGRITSPGESIVCLPNRVMVEIVNKSSDVDAVAGAR